MARVRCRSGEVQLCLSGNRAAQAVRDPTFWAYNHAVLCATHGVLFELQNYMEGCPCHHRSFHSKPGFSPGRPYFQRRQQYIGETGVANSTCPLRGRRAPELAAGRHKDYLQDLIAHTLGMLLMKTCGLSQEQRDFVVRDWEGAKTVMLEVFTLKFAYWLFLPHKLCILACTDNRGTSEETARNGLLSCIQEYGQLTDQQKYSMWPMVARVLDPRSDLHGEVVAFTERGESLRPALVSENSQFFRKRL